MSQTNITTKHSYTTLTLYRAVFGSQPVVLVLLFLLLSIVLQPLERALAASLDDGEASSVETSLVPEVVGDSSLVTPVVDEVTTGVETVPLNPPPVASTEEPTLPLISDGNVDAVAPEASTTVNGVSEDVIATSTDAELEAVTEVSSTSNSIIATSLLESEATTTPTTLPEEEIIVSDIVVEASSTEALLEELAATTTEATTTIDLPLIHSTYNDNEIRFDKDQCSVVADGSYYCHPKTIDTSMRDGLLAAPDEDGDLEIFAVKDGEYVQLTFNTVDDASPYYDSESNTMVWHRLIDDVYNIFSYDFSEEKETQFTDAGVNDMEPTRYGDYTVWQRWVDGYWHVMLDNGVVIMQLSNTATHNIAPSIRGQIVMWQTTGESGNKELQTYDLLTKAYVTITDSEDASMVNPRMMMVYEAVYDSGEVVTRGFDLLTGKIVPLHTSSKNVPDEVPESDSTGETRALIQNKPSVKDIEIDTEPEPVPDVPIISGTSTALTLDLTATSTPVTDVSIDTFLPVLIDSAFDLYLPASSTQFSAEI